MSVLQIDLFGTFDVRSNGHHVAGLEMRKAQELLGFLLLQRSRTYTREYLAELLWDQRAPAQSRKYLRQTLWHVQSALAGSHSKDKPLLLVEGEAVCINHACDLRLDVAEFEAAYGQAQGVAGNELNQQRAAQLRSAVALYRGDLLQGCYEDWCIFERERLQNMYLAMLDKLIDCCQAHGQYELGLDYGATILRYDRARERTHRRMMRLYYLAGDRISALRQYDQLERALREELDVQPSHSSVTLRNQIRADSIDGDLPPSSGPISPPKPRRSGAPADPLLHLRRLHARLIHMRRQINQEIDAIELTLADT